MIRSGTKHSRTAFRFAVTLALLCVTIALPVVAGTIGTTTVTPSSAAVGVATPVIVTAVITDTGLIASTVQLQQLDSNGKVVATLGTLHDDGLNGDAAANDNQYSLQTTVYLTSPGPATFRVSAGFNGSILRALSSPVVVNVIGTGVGITILTPANLTYLNTSPINVTGTVGDPNATVKINGINAPVTAGHFLATLPLVEGLNELTAVATNSNSTQTTASVQVTLDTTPPHLTIDSPTANTTTTAASIAVSGTANDVVVGTVNNGDVQVTVNGIAAQVANRTYSAANVPLAVGVNTIQAAGKDRAGNGTTVTATITRVLPSAPPPAKIGASVIVNSLSIVSGNNQSAAIGTTLPNPLVVSMINSASAPVANQPVVFTVTGNNGLVSAGGPSASSVVVNTNANGQAQVAWALGQRSGAGINTVRVSSSLAVGPVNFTATGTTSAAAQINVDSGNNQTGALGQSLPFPLVAVVTDAGHNRVTNVPVTFTVTGGGGNIGGLPSQNVTTDSNGRAIAVLSLGTQPGNDNNVVQASYTGNAGASAIFSATAKAPGNPANTTISGVVLDNGNNPIQGVTIRLFLTNQANNNNLPMQIGTPVQSNAQGAFLIQQAPVGFFKLMADGTTAVGPKSYPTLEYDLVTVAGQDNTVGNPIYLPALDTVNKLCVDATHGGTLTLPQSPGFALTVLPGSATFPGGSKTGCVSVTPVNGDKVPMAPGFGQQPRFIVTIQPVGTVFNPPAPITIPNVDGLKPMAVTEMYSYDHDLSMFVAIGTGTVSNDGSVIASNPGVGVLKAGWHCGGDPNADGYVADCGDCKICQGGQCGPDLNATTCDDHLFCTANDLCVFGVCKGTPIADTDQGSQSALFGKDGAGISIGPLEASINIFTILGIAKVPEFEIKYNLADKGHCCEKLQGSTVTNTVSTWDVKVSLPESDPIPIPGISVTCCTLFLVGTIDIVKLGFFLTGGGELSGEIKSTIDNCEGMTDREGSVTDTFTGSIEALAQALGPDFFKADVKGTTGVSGVGTVANGMLSLAANWTGIEVSGEVQLVSLVKVSVKYELVPPKVLGTVSIPIP